jgi:excisionase family DNA binding protein
MAKDSYRIDEAAERWHVHPKTVERAIHRGEVDAFKIGSTWRIRSDEVSRVEKKMDYEVLGRTR